METPPRVLVVVATYNEIENLPRLVAAIHNALPQADLLVVDDHSPDGTATVAGFEHALARDYDVVCTLDADFSHDPAVLPQLVAALDDADVAIGSRYVPGGTIEGWPLRRRVASRVMNSLSRWVLRLPARDTSGAFRAYRCAKLREIDLHDISSQGYAYLEEIVWLLARRGATFAEVPITFRERELGESKISINELGGKLRMLSRLAVRR
jgi:dolichol-phosphate mannosyltransferase